MDMGDTDRRRVRMDQTKGVSVMRTKRVQHDGVKVTVRFTEPDPEFWISLIDEMMTWEKTAPPEKETGGGQME
jgi:hypothetical protein|tara:strand:- start:20 stop:238 length:219 start_codon:yes stop_codon:yes gene_type:complete